MKKKMHKRIKLGYAYSFTKSKYMYFYDILILSKSQSYKTTQYPTLVLNIFLEFMRVVLTLSARVLWAIVLPVLLSLLYDSISAIQFSHCFRTSCLFSQKCLWMTSRKQGVGLRICSSMAHRTVACRMLASYSRELAVPEGVPRDRSYPGSLKYGSDTKISDWMDTKTYRMLNHSR